MKFDSKEELYFSWYFKELQEAGYLKEYTFHPRTYELMQPVTTKTVKIMKKVPNKENEIVLLPGLSYTPDVELIWTDKPNPLIHKLKEPLINKSSKKVVFWTDDNNRSLVEIKADFDQNNMTREFHIKRKILYHLQGEFVNLSKMGTVFKNTFTPKRFLLTDKTLKPRAIKWEVRSLTKYMNE